MVALIGSRYVRFLIVIHFVPFTTHPSFVIIHTKVAVSTHHIPKQRPSPRQQVIVIRYPDGLCSSSSSLSSSNQPRAFM
jgi:hypothetical protein